MDTVERALIGNEKAKGFLEMQIELCKEWRKVYGDMYNGLRVGDILRKQLLDDHIQFCKQVLELLENKGEE